MRKINLKETGITLIALVVTIIVLLILAGVTISIAISNNGLISRAGEAKEEHRGGTVQEQRDLWMTDIQAAKYSNDGSETLDELLQRLGPSGLKLLTAEEIETIRATGSVKIGSRTIDFTLPDNDDIIEVAVMDDIVYLLSYAGDLFSIDIEELTNVAMIREIDLSQKNIVDSDVKELYYEGSYLKQNGELYINRKYQDIIPYDDEDDIYVKFENIKKFYPNFNDKAMLTNSNKIIKYNDGLNRFEELEGANNAKEYLGDDSYSTLDGHSVLINMRGQKKTFDEEIVWKYSEYYLSSNHSLYKETDEGILSKILDNVEIYKTNGDWVTYLSDDGKIYKDINGTYTELANNVKSCSEDLSYFINNNNELFGLNNDHYEKIADNVEECNNYSYISTQKRIIIENYINDQYVYTDTGHDILNYGMKNSVWFKTTDKKFYVYYCNIIIT